MRIVAVGILAVALVTGCAYDVQDDSGALGTKHQLASGSGSGGDVIDGKRVLTGGADDVNARPGDWRPKPPPPPGDPEPSPWRFTDPSTEPEPSPWGNNGQGGPLPTGNDPAEGHKTLKLHDHVLSD